MVVFNTVLKELNVVVVFSRLMPGRKTINRKPTEHTLRRIQSFGISGADVIIRGGSVDFIFSADATGTSSGARHEGLAAFQTRLHGVSVVCGWGGRHEGKATMDAPTQMFSLSNSALVAKADSFVEFSRINTQVS